MPAYAVKHIVADHGPLARIMKEVRKTPYSYTSKGPEASDAAKGWDVYVIEVNADRSTRSYALGYRYQATEKFALTGGALWKGEFKYKNSATPGDPPVGVYFEPPLPLTDPTVVHWLTNKLPGMAEIPGDVLRGLQVAEATALAKRFA